MDLFIPDFLRQQPWLEENPLVPLLCLVLSYLLAVLLPAAAAAAFFVQEEAVKAEGDAEAGEAEEEDVEQAADEEESEDAETERGCEHLISTH